MTARSPGGLIAGTLAYRLFLGLPPSALLVVAGLGIAADAAAPSPRRAAESIRIAGLVSNSVAAAAGSTIQKHWRTTLGALCSRHCVIGRPVRA